jgi:hypothetical protein
MKRLPGVCPMCRSTLTVKSLYCPGCSIKIEGNFALPKILSLSDDQLEFVEVFLRARGNIKEVERELGISYPTVRARLDEIVAKLGIEIEPREEVDASLVLASLESGELTVNEALKRLRGEE